VHLPRILAAAAAAVVLTTAGCGGSSSTDSHNNAPKTSSSVAVTPTGLSTALGCTMAPGAGAPPDNFAAAIQYYCTGADLDTPSSRLVFFTTSGDETAFVNLNKRYETVSADNPTPISQVAGNGWSVWGTDQKVISAALNSGGKES
jgi:hypothetical protein